MEMGFGESRITLREPSEADPSILSGYRLGKNMAEATSGEALEMVLQPEVSVCLKAGRNQSFQGSGSRWEDKNWCTSRREEAGRAISSSAIQAQKRYNIRVFGQC